MKQGTSFPEVMIALFIISIALIIFLKIVADYGRTLVFAKEMFVLNSALHEKYQLLIAYRNKMLETESSERGPLPSGDFCIYFNTSTSKINTSSPPCQYKFLNDNDSNINYIVKLFSYPSSSYIKVMASSTKPLKLEVNLEGFLTNLHLDR